MMLFDCLVANKLHGTPKGNGIVSKWLNDQQEILDAKFVERELTLFEISKLNNKQKIKKPTLFDFSKRRGK